MMLLGSGTLAAHGAAGPSAPLNPPHGITLEYVGQGLVRSAAEVYQYGFFTHVSGAKEIFSASPNNETTALFTFHNQLATTRVIDNGPLRIVDREGTSTIYLRTTPGASFEDPDSFKQGTPVLAAHLRHQVILDTANNNTILVHFDLTLLDTGTFTVGDVTHRMGMPGQKMSWSAYGRPNTSANHPGQFVFAGMGILHVPAPPGLTLNRSADAKSIRLKLDNSPGARSLVEASSNLTDWTLVESVDHTTPTIVVDRAADSTEAFFRASTGYNTKGSAAVP